MKQKTKHIFSAIQRFFDFSKGERRGLWVLLLILILLLLTQIFVTNFYLPKKSGKLPKEMEKKVNDFYLRQQFIEDSLAINKTENYDKFKENISTKHTTLHPFPFNPNNLPEKSWKALGLSDKQIKTIKNYEAKGGKFYVKEDLKKIYSISETEFNQLEPYILIPHVEGNKKYTEKTSTTPTKLLLNLNTADSLELQKIPGIGIKLSGRIIRFRNALGGFYAKQQLLEIYGFDTNNYQQISSYLYINQNDIKQININTANYVELNKHPYIDAYLAKTIIQLREKNGRYTSIEDMKKQTKLYNDLFLKLKPYLSVQ
jgi:competence protein ComEA